MENYYMEEEKKHYTHTFRLRYQVPLQIPLTAVLELKTEIKAFRLLLRLDGLYIKGEIEQKIFRYGSTRRSESPRSGHDSDSETYLVDEQRFYFTTALSDQEVQEKNLLNLGFDLAIEQVNYHLVKKKGQVYLLEELEIRWTIMEYQIRRYSQIDGESLLKKSGFFQQIPDSLEGDLLKSYPLQLPDDLISIHKLSGNVETWQAKEEKTGLHLDFFIQFQGEYITENGSIKAFFFQEVEEIFLPLQAELRETHFDEIRVDIFLTSVTQEEGQLLVLYHWRLELFQRAEVFYYTRQAFVRSLNLPVHTFLQEVYVGQITGPFITSHLVQGNICLPEKARVKKIQAMIKEIQTTEMNDGIIIVGRLYYDCFYLTPDHQTKTLQGQLPFETFLSLVELPTEERGNWQIESENQVIDWKEEDCQLTFQIILDHRLWYCFNIIEPVLLADRAKLPGMELEKKYLTKELAIGQLETFETVEFYLNRYCQQVQQITADTLKLESRRLSTGWLLKGQGELVIYYLTRSGERHHQQLFDFYQFMPGNTENIQIEWKTILQVLDLSLREDGSKVKVNCLVQSNYRLKNKQVGYLVTALNSPLLLQTEKILKMGYFERVFQKELLLSGAGEALAIQDMQIMLLDYHYHFVGDELLFQGQLQIQIHYQNGSLKDKVELKTVEVELKEMVSEDDRVQQCRAVPGIKGYDYLLTDHPQGEKGLILHFVVEIHYRLLGNSQDC